MPEHAHTNRLAGETSPYLLQHAHNPVDWHPWGEEALRIAREQDKPIFLSIGYSACHWCHVMERESFENEATASLMNELFVNIKVDREERPDLDAIYMEAVQAMTGQGGWPMSVFLMPDGRPFYGGTYFPPEPRYNMPGFPQVLRSVADAYRQRRDQVDEQAERLTEMLGQSAALQSKSSDLSQALLDEAVAHMQQRFDEEHGGFGHQPKFPQPMSLDFILTQYLRTRDLDTLYMAERTLEQMALGGIYDQLGGGFHRYSVDAIWLTPHFEKMLYDNSQLLRTYLHAWQITARPLYRRIVDETIAYVLSEMTAPDGGFYSTQDADSEGEEGKFFVWMPEEIDAALDDQAAALFKAHYGVTQHGNFEGRNILYASRNTDSLAQESGMEPDAVERTLAEARRTLFDRREQRVKPARDEKVLTEWNGLMIHALAECGVTLGNAPALAAAERAAGFILARMSQPDGRLYRTFKDGRARLNAYLEDYAAFVRGLIALYEATFDLRWLGEASRLTRIMFEQFHDAERGSFYQTGASHEDLVVRRKDFIDSAIPSGNSLAAECLIRLAALLGQDEYRSEAARIVLTVKDALGPQSLAFGRLLCSVDALLSPSREIAIVGDPADPAAQALLHTVRSRFLPHAVVALKHPDEEGLLPVLESRTLVDGKPAAYVCENYACRLPVTTPEELAELLD